MLHTVVKLRDGSTVLEKQFEHCTTVQHTRNTKKKLKAAKHFFFSSLLLILFIISTVQVFLSATAVVVAVSSAVVTSSFNVAVGGIDARVLTLLFVLICLVLPLVSMTKLLLLTLLKSILDQFQKKR